MTETTIYPCLRYSLLWTTKHIH